MKDNKIFTGLKILAIEAAMIFAFTACELPIGDGEGGDDDIKHDTIDDTAYKYNGMLSEFSYDINDDRAMDITVTHELAEDNGMFYQLFHFNTAGNIRLLAHGNTFVTGLSDVDRSVVESVEKGFEIKRGLEEIVYPIDYYYGNKYLVTGLALNSDATIPRRLEGPITENRGYIALIEDKGDGWHFGWIEYEIDPDPVDLIVTMIFPPQGLQADARFKVTDSYINPEPNEYIKAGYKRLD